MAKKITTEEFIERAEKIHGKYNYDYSKIHYVNAKTPITIICPKHGEFKKTPDKFLSGQGCKKCSNEKKSLKHLMTTKEFVEKANRAHGNKYDYSKTDLEHRLERNKVIITCPLHGDFKQEISSHLNGHGCPKCANNDKLSTEDFIASCKTIYGDKYDYTKTIYKNNNTNVIVTCKKHGEFQKPPFSLLKGKGCQQCSREAMSIKNSKGKQKFVKEAQALYGVKNYDYSNVKYINDRTPIEIICPKHGSFWQLPSNHLKGKEGCPKCQSEKMSKLFLMTTKEFVEKAKKIHGDKYDYSKTDLKNRKNNDKVLITCRKHGDFWQNITMHIEGHGCPKCNYSHLENEISTLLKENHIVFEEQKRFDWLGKQSLDFYIPSKQIAIECQGEQHFKPIKHFGGNIAFKVQQERDKRKKQLCEKHSIKIIYYSKENYNNDVISEEKQLVKIINNF
jgi:Zn finger protein HypA/HybF involved in hydrogenase expression